jgi:hypothetical protein
MEPVTRRSFLVTGSVGAAGAATAFGTGWALSTAADDESALSQDEIDAINGPLVVQVKDPAAGELEVLVGEREVVFTDRALVAKLLRASQS